MNKTLRKCLLFFALILLAIATLVVFAFAIAELVKIIVAVFLMLFSIQTDTVWLDALCGIAALALSMLFTTWASKITQEVFHNGKNDKSKR